MKGKIIHTVASLVVFASLSLAMVGLTWPSVAQSETAETHEHEKAVSEDAGHGQGEPELSEAEHHDEAEGGHQHEHLDMQEPLGFAALSEMTCEHESPILQCDECRYEVGVARLDPALSKDLVASARVGAHEHVSASLRLTGQVDLDLTRVVEVASPGSGRIENVQAVLGDTVEATDTLVVVRSSEFGQAQADSCVASAQLELARETFEREKQLHDDKVGSQADYQSARNQLSAAQATLGAARKRLQLFGLSEEQIAAIRADDEVAFGEFVLTAPISGTIIAQNAVRGQLVDSTDTLCRIADLSCVWVWCDVYEADLAAVHDRFVSGSVVTVQISVRAFPETIFRGVVDMIGSQLDPETRTVKVRVRAENPGGRLKPGMFVTVSLDLGGSGTAMMVPETAVLSDEGRHFVFVRLNDEFWIRRDVSVGPTAADLVPVYGGLSEGDVIATKGAFMFKSEVLKEKMGAGCAH